MTMQYEHVPYFSKHEQEPQLLVLSVKCEIIEKIIDLE